MVCIPSIRLLRAFIDTLCSHDSLHEALLTHIEPRSLLGLATPSCIVRSVSRKFRPVRFVSQIKACSHVRSFNVTLLLNPYNAHVSQIWPGLLVAARSCVTPFQAGTTPSRGSSRVPCCFRRIHGLSMLLRLLQVCTRPYACSFKTSASHEGHLTNAKEPHVQRGP